MKQGSVGGILWWLGERTFTKTTPGIATAYIKGDLILRPYATFPHPNVLAGFLVVTFPLLVFNSIQITRLVRIPLIVFILLTTFITFSRSSWITLIVVIGVLIVYRYIDKSIYKTKYNLLVVLGSVLLLVSIIAVVPFVTERFSNLASVDQQSITLRSELNHAAIAIIRDHPLVGVGLNNFLVHLPNYHSINTYQDIQPAHNIYLLAVSEIGFLGAGVIVLPILFIYKLKKRHIQNTRYNILISLIALLLLGLFDHYPYTIHQMNLLGSILVGLVFSREITFK
ncbi:O-antigen ligase family protein [Candidatus Roizmanbacteria bacterium]|nr:O-antigen ligase family protein [Candidatus Roizmanbacteria bacterium]